MATPDKKVTKIAEREVLGADGKPVVNYKEGTVAQYTHNATKHVVRYDFSKAKTALIDALGQQAADMTIAFACEGLITKTGHAVNKATNGNNATGDVVAALEEFETDVILGDSWTNREGGNEVGAEAIIAAIAELRQRPIEGVRAYWQGGEYNGKTFPVLDAESKTAWRTNDQIKAIVWQHRADKAKAKHAAAPATAAPDLGF